MRCLPALLLGALVGAALALALAARADRVTITFEADGRVKWSVSGSPPGAAEPRGEDGAAS